MSQLNYFNTKEYAQQLRKDLKVFSRFSEYITALSQSTNVTESLGMLEGILSFDSHESEMLRMDNRFWYATTHWVSVVFAQLMKSTSTLDINVLMPQGQKTTILHFKEWSNAEFRFVKAPLAAGGFYLEEDTYNLRVAYWDIYQKRFYIDTTELAMLMQSNAAQLAGVKTLLQFQQHLFLIGHQLEQLGYDTDIHYLNVNNAERLEMRQLDLTTEVFDSLFIQAAHSGFILRLLSDDQNEGAYIDFEDGRLSIIHERDQEGHSHWYYDLTHLTPDTTIFTLIQVFPFFGKWYNDWQNQVGINDHREVFTTV